MSPKYDAVADAPQLPTRRGRPQPETPPEPPADPLQPMTVAVRKRLKRRFKIVCAQQGITQQDAMGQALTAWIESVTAADEEAQQG